MESGDESPHSKTQGESSDVEAMFAGVGKKVEWDVEKMEVTNFPELNHFVRRSSRPGWEV